MMEKIGLALAALVTMLTGAIMPTVPAMADGLADSDLCNEITDPDLLEAAGCNTTKKADEVVNAVLTVVLSFVGLIAVGVMVYGGFVYMTSTGDAGKAQKAKHIIMYGLIGLVVTLLAYAIVAFVSRSIGS